ncbi:hypothetical protein WR25_16617 [Diploscapter pachys]|uniref:Nuclear receptor domain-containing protein n=1 Tax=Diploscapter pachys TaxID=2018661 RepID=A0A2A2L5D8_9BILA|nr:hypothetical protein WR25_16617 [Diploscapter pachys]
MGRVGVAIFRPVNISAGKLYKWWYIRRLSIPELRAELASFGGSRLSTQVFIPRANTSSSGGGNERRIANKICRVCGDKAFSYNFNVITCESCKAFFRRNANKEKEIRCPFNERCEINVVSRRFCQRCRLAKCFEVGMKKEWIMSDEARLEKKARVEENRERRIQDAMRRRQNEPEIVDAREQRYMQRNRVKSESRGDKEEQLPLSLREFVLTNSINDMPLAAPPPAAEIAAQLGASPTCASHLLMDPIPTTAAHSLADVNAQINCLSTMDVDPSTTMSSNGFLPPSVPDSNHQPGPSSVSAGILPVNVTNAVESSLMAQAQLAAAQVQVQAAINHQQHQIAAAVVAQQVAAQMATVAPVQTAPTPVIPPLSQTITPQMTVPILTPSVPPPAAILSISSPMNPDMVTIPREIFMKLMENNSQRSGRCICQCACGRYPPGSVIVDEVTRDLVAAGNNSASSETSKEETKLETAEDFQRNGLLPSDDSSVQWLNTSAPVVDPSGIMEERPTGRRDSIYKSPIDRQGNLAVEDNEFSPLTQPDHERLSEVLSSNSTCNPVAYESSHCWVINFDTGIERMVRMCKTLAPFRALTFDDQFTLVKNSCLPYLVIRAVVRPDPTVSASGYPLTEADAPSALDAFLEDAAKLFSGIRDDVREHEGAMLVFALLCMFDAMDLQLNDADIVNREFDAYLRLLKRLLYSSLNDVVSCSTEIRSLFETLSNIREHSMRLYDLIDSASPHLLHPTLRQLLQ